MYTVTGLMLALAASLLLFAPSKVEAKIYKCIASNGNVSYSQQPCPTSEKTSKVMEGKDEIRERFDCRVARSFSRYVADEMKNGQSADDMFSMYGGIDSISATTVSVINYVFSHKSNVDSSVQRIAALSGARCDSGTYTQEIDCEHFPQQFIDEQGGCSVIKGESTFARSDNNSETSTYAQPVYGKNNERSDEDSDGGSVQPDSISQNINQNYNVRTTSTGDKQNECRVAIRDEIGALQKRMRGSLSMDMHKELSGKRASLREAYEAC